MTVFLLHGLVVDSPVHLGAAVAARGSQVDLWLVRGNGAAPAAFATVVARAHDEATGRRYHVSVDRRRWVMRFDGSATFTGSHDSDHIVVHAPTSTPDSLLRVLIAGPVLVTVSLLRQAMLFHASAVVWVGRKPARSPVVAILGQSGSGKSTVARMLTGAGRLLFSDDALRVDVSHEGARVHRGTLVSRLRTGLPGHVALPAVSADGRTLIRSQGVDPPAVGQLALVVQPRLSPAFDRVRLVPASGAEALLALCTSFPLEGIQDGALLSYYLERSGMLLNAVRVRKVEIPWGSLSSVSSLQDELLERVEDELSLTIPDFERGERAV